MGTQEMFSEIIKLCRVTWVEVAPHEHHLDSQGLGIKSSQLCSIMKALGDLVRECRVSSTLESWHYSVRTQSTHVLSR